MFGHSDVRLWAWDTKSGKTRTSEVFYSGSGVLSRTVHYSPVRKTTQYLPKASHPECFFETQRLVQSCGFATITTPTQTSTSR